MTTTPNPAVAQAIDTFVAWMNTEGQKPEGYSFAADRPGQKVVRIVMSAHADGTARSVHCFIDRQTGDVLKAEGWKRPAPGARYNLLTGWDTLVAAWNWSGGYLYR